MVTLYKWFVYAVSAAAQVQVHISTVGARARESAICDKKMMISVCLLIVVCAWQDSDTYAKEQDRLTQSLEVSRVQLGACHR